MTDGALDGSDLFCPACGSWSEAFGEGPDGRPNARCPVCQSLERHRFLAYLLASISDPDGPVLDVAPQKQIRRILEGLAGVHPYVGLDRFEPERSIDLLGDITQLPFRSGCFPMVVCYHVLEHVPDDRSAMGELRRVVSDDGLVLIQVPHRPTAPTDEDPSAPPEERIERFGQEDHVRFYGKDFDERLTDAGLHPWTVRPQEVLDEEELRRLALSPTETVWLCGTTSGAPPVEPWPPAMLELEFAQTRIQDLITGSRDQEASTVNDRVSALLEGARRLFR